MNDTQRDPLLLDHEYDGIQELDNKLPRWWVWLFYFTIIFAGLYMVHYHVLGHGDLMIAQYEKEMKVGDAIKSQALAKFEQEMASLTPSKDQAVLVTGHDVFLKNCAPCHAQDGGGIVGPNLTDDYWIHGKEFKDNLRVIYNGVPEKGMVTWKSLLKPAEILAVGSYIYTLRGTKPANPKPPENTQPATPAVNVYE